MSTEQMFEPIGLEALLTRVRALREQGHRLVQISATRLPEQLELTYSFDLEGRLTNLRLQLPAIEARVPSISPVYWCAFLYENELHDLFNLQVDGIAVDFHGTLYTTAVKFPFGSTRPPLSKPASQTDYSPAPSTPTKPATALATGPKTDVPASDHAIRITQHASRSPDPRPSTLH